MYASWCKMDFWWWFKTNHTFCVCWNTQTGQPDGCGLWFSRFSVSWSHHPSGLSIIAPHWGRNYYRNGLDNSTDVDTNRKWIGWCHQGAVRGAVGNRSESRNETFWALSFCRYWDRVVKVLVRMWWKRKNWKSGDNIFRLTIESNDKYGN